MKKDNLKPYELFADLAEQQRIVKAKMKPTTLEEARAKIKWLKSQRTVPIEKRKRN